MLLEILVIALVLHIVWIKFETWRILRAFKASDFSGKRVFITGGSSGIGKAMCKELVKRGAEVAIAARRLEELEKTKKESSDPSKVHCIQVDLFELDKLKGVAD